MNSRNRAKDQGIGKTGVLLTNNNANPYLCREKRIMHIAFSPFTSPRRRSTANLSPPRRACKHAPYVAGVSFQWSVGNVQGSTCKELNLHRSTNAPKMRALFRKITAENGPLFLRGTCAGAPCIGVVFRPRPLRRQNRRFACFIGKLIADRSSTLTIRVSVVSG
jgi:hypothetical protein